MPDIHETEIGREEDHRNGQPQNDDLDRDAEQADLGKNESGKPVDKIVDEGEHRSFSQLDSSP